MKSSPRSRAWCGRCWWRTPSPSSSDSSSSGWTLMPEAPQAAQATFNFKAAITHMVQRNASDLLLKVGRPATIRVNGELVALDSSPLKPEELKSLAEQIMTPRQVKEFAEHKEADFAIGVPGVGRFRTNVYQQRGTVAFAFRAIPYEVKTIKDLSLPPVMEEIALKPRGLALVTALKAAATGPLVFSTLHTTDATQSIPRVISFFPPHQHEEVRHLLSTALQAVISLRLVPRKDGRGRAPAAEVLINTAAVQDNIRDLAKALNIPDLIAEGSVQYGMQSFDQSLFYWYKHGVISYESAVFFATNPSEFALKVSGVDSSADRLGGTPGARAAGAIDLTP